MTAIARLIRIRSPRTDLPSEGVRGAWRGRRRVQRRPRPQSLNLLQVVDQIHALEYAPGVAVGADLRAAWACVRLPYVALPKLVTWPIAVGESWHAVHGGLCEITTACQRR